MNLIHHLERRPTDTQCDIFDRMPKALRELTHDYGFSVVHAFIQKGITNPGTIKYLVKAVHLGAREPGQRKATAKYPARAVLSHVDAFLIRYGAGFSARQVITSMRDVNWTAVSTAPTDAMVAASMATIANHDMRVTKEEKHFRRLQAALNAGDNENWGPR